ncbi:TPA: DUF1366 domain-containing protein [Streptococcus agalactiae]
MKQWNIVGKPFPIYQDGVVVKTDVRLQGDDGTYLPQELIGNHVDKDNQSLIRLVLETFAKENVVDFAMLESVKDIEQLKADKVTLIKKLQRLMRQFLRCRKQQKICSLKLIKQLSS